MTTITRERADQQELPFRILPTHGGFYLECTVCRRSDSATYDDRETAAAAMNTTSCRGAHGAAR